MRRYGNELKGERYIVDLGQGVVHDLDHESKTCKIDKLIASGKYRTYVSIIEAILEGQNRGHKCTGKFAQMV